MVLTIYFESGKDTQKVNLLLTSGQNGFLTAEKRVHCDQYQLGKANLDK